MIRTMMWSGWLSLKRDPVALGLTFVLPIIFFSIFAGVFGNMSGGGGGGLAALRVVVVDEDGSDVSRRLITALDRDAALRVIRGPTRAADAEEEPEPYTRADALSLVEDGRRRVAVVIPEGYGERFGEFGSDAPAIEILADKVADPVAHQMVSGLLQKAVMTATPDLMIERGLGQFEKYAGAMTPAQRAAMDRFLPDLRAALDDQDDASGQDEDSSNEGEGGESEFDPASAFGGGVRVQVTDVRQADKTAEAQEQKSATVTYYAAAIGVMFLLFSMTGAAGAFLQEETSGTLERVLNANISMTQMLAGYWIFFALIGFCQLTVMFIWGWAVFGIELWTTSHVIGFIAMAAFSAAAAAGFGMMLGTTCRSQAQLQGISTVVILIMSAMGGSMFPRFMMPETMQQFGLATFNAWAIDGFRKVFWTNKAVWELWPQLLVLAAMTVGFLFVARLVARRWEMI